MSRDAGHSSIAITDARYGHISSAASAASAEAIAGRLPRLRADVIDLEQARRRRLVRLEPLGEIERVPGGFEAIWMDARGLVHSQAFDTYDQAVGHIAQHEAAQRCPLPRHRSVGNADRSTGALGFFTRLAAGLANAGVASLRFDLRGHGGSEGRQEELTLRRETASGPESAGATESSARLQETHHRHTGHRVRVGFFEHVVDRLRS
ncbi:hypothetical protein [Nocardia asteroides]|uniref:hypothetical protein n=1 Tax=Nocardia asteroides TaxID=1824 RepID=UPI0036513CC9